VKLAQARRISQIVFLALFLCLLFQTEFRGSFHAVQGDPRIPYPVRWFLELDPLIALGSALSSHALYRGLLWSLAIILPTVFLGRFFCGWICPLGTLNHWIGGFRSKSKLGLRRIESNRYRRWQELKYYLLAALLVAALLGLGLYGLLDPISLLVRSLALAVLPALNYAVNATVDLLSRPGWKPLFYVGAALHFLLKDTLLNFSQPRFRQGLPIGLIFAVILLLNMRFTRFWCRALCPLGALLGLLSRWSVFGLEKRASRCTDCNRCQLNCQGGDDPIPGVRWRQAECHLCMNCVAECPESGLVFRFFPARQTTREGPDLERRRVLTSLVAGAALIPVLRSAPGLAVEHSRARIRPPGALDEFNFLERCIRCGECMKVCPNHALHPSFTEAGPEGLWTPVLVARIGYCEPGCVLCGQVCPTGAIWEFTLKEKGWTGGANSSPIRLGTAFYDRGRCLPWAMATECIVCEEWCPTSPKAIYLRPADVADREGQLRRVRQPYVEPALCVGCGACEHTCPVNDAPAVYVSSVGESRSKTNQMLLPHAAEKTAVVLPAASASGLWRKAGETRVFAAADLWKYVDGDAEHYLRAGVQQTFTTLYRQRGGAEAMADVYILATSGQARALFESEPAAGSRPVPIGAGGRSYGPSVTFWQGRYFVRLTAYQDVGDTLLDLAGAMVAGLR
jgi:polyferredoxin